MAGEPPVGVSKGEAREPRFFGAPTTRPGWWAARLLAAFAGLLILLNVLVAFFEQEGGEDVPGNLMLFIPGFGSAACAVAGGGFAAFAIFRRGERSALAFLALLAGMLMTWVLVAEAIFPH